MRAWEDEFAEFATALAPALRRQARERGIADHEARERIGAVADHAQAVARIGIPVLRQRLQREQARDRAGHRLDRRERAIELMADDAHDALPRLALFLAQSARQLRDHEQLVRLTALAEAAAPNLPPPAAAGKYVRDDAAGLLREHARETELRCAAPLQILAGRAQQVLTGSIDDA